jgi:phosphatidylglycerophosphate synthase
MRAIYKNIPNVLSSFRLFAVPFLLIIAWQNRPGLFLAIFAVSLLTDAIDGFIARYLNVTSNKGALLDSAADIISYLAAALCVFKLWPDILHREAFFIVMGVIMLIVPAAVGIIKFKRLPSYHTWAAKSVAVLAFIAVYTLLITDISWPFRCVVILQYFVSIEEISITVWLSEQRCNIPSLWHLVHSPS